MVMVMVMVMAFLLLGSARGPVHRCVGPEEGAREGGGGGRRYDN